MGDYGRAGLSHSRVLCCGKSRTVDHVQRIHRLHREDFRFRCLMADALNPRQI